MKILTYVTAIFLIFGLLGVPGGAFAQDSSLTGSNTVLQHSDSSFLTSSYIPLLKGGSRSSHVSKKIHDDDDDTSDTGDNSTDDGSGWWIAIIIVIIVIAIIVLAVWYFFLRK